MLPDKSRTMRASGATVENRAVSSATAAGQPIKLIKAANRKITQHLFMDLLLSGHGRHFNRSVSDSDIDGDACLVGCVGSGYGNFVKGLPPDLPSADGITGYRDHSRSRRRRRR